MALFRDQLVRIFAANSLLLAFACSPPDSTGPAKVAEPFQPILSLRPVSVSLAAGATQSFQVEINYQDGVRYFKQPVGWRVMESDGGTITAAGLYTAPGAAGIFHVQVRREDFPEMTAVATVTVR